MTNAVHEKIKFIDGALMPIQVSPSGCINESLSGMNPRYDAVVPIKYPSGHTESVHVTAQKDSLFLMKICSRGTVRYIMENNVFTTMKENVDILIHDLYMLLMPRYLKKILIMNKEVLPEEYAYDVDRYVIYRMAGDVHVMYVADTPIPTDIYTFLTKHISSYYTYNDIPFLAYRFKACMESKMTSDTYRFDNVIISVKEGRLQVKHTQGKYVVDGDIILCYGREFELLEILYQIYDIQKFKEAVRVSDMLRHTHQCKILRDRVTVTRGTDQIEVSC